MNLALGIFGFVLAAWSGVVLNKMLGTVSRAARNLAAMGAKESLDIGNRARVVILGWIVALLAGVALLVLSVARLFSA